MKYTISEFAELLGVTVDTLRLYEKYNIIKPIKNKSNNYRYFNDYDARNMLMSRWYRSLDFSMQDVSDLIRNESFDDIAEKIAVKKEELETEVRLKMRLLNRMKCISGDLAEGKKYLDQCCEKTLPGIYRIRQTDKNSLVKEEGLKDKVEEWMKYMPHTFFSFRMNNREVLTENNVFDYNWGLAMYDKDFLELGLKLDDMIEYIGPGKYISSVISTTQDYITGETLEHMLGYIQQNKLSIRGDIFGRILLTEKAREIRETLMEVNIPIM